MIVWYFYPNECSTCGCIGCSCRKALTQSSGFEVRVKVSLYIYLLELWNVECMVELTQKSPCVFTNCDVRHFFWFGYYGECMRLGNTGIDEVENSDQVQWVIQC